MVEAIAAVASKAVSAAPSLGGAADTQMSTAPAFAGSGPAEGLAHAFRDAVSTLKTQDAALGPLAGPPDPVAAAKAQMQGGDGKSLVADTAPKAAQPNGGAAGLGALEKSFDHAVFVSLVSQVVGGVSQAASTLVKQS